MRVNLNAAWLRGWTIPGGIRADAAIGVAADIFNVTQDSTTKQNQSQLVPYSALALRYLKSGRKDAFVSFLSAVAMGGIGLGGFTYCRECLAHLLRELAAKMAEKKKR